MAKPGAPKAALAPGVKPGVRVTAKRSGWDEPPEGLVTEYDILDPPAWRDAGLPAHDMLTGQYADRTVIR